LFEALADALGGLFQPQAEARGIRLPFDLDCQLLLQGSQSLLPLFEVTAPT
jgi:hypothetical protein